MKRTRHHKKQTKGKTIILKNIENNFKTYMTCVFMFAVGIIGSVIYINNISDTQVAEFNRYITDMVSATQNIDTDLKCLFYDVSTKNLMFSLILWIAGITIIGLIADYILILYKGFCIGYTISALTLTIGRLRTLKIVFTGLLLHNLLIIPAIFFATTSGMKIIKTVIKNRGKEEIAFEYLRHTIISIFVSLILVIASAIEVFVSYGLLKYIWKL